MTTEYIWSRKPGARTTRYHIRRYGQYGQLYLEPLCGPFMNGGGLGCDRSKKVADIPQNLTLCPRCAAAQAKRR